MNNKISNFKSQISKFRKRLALRLSKGFTPLEAGYFNNRRNKSFGLLTGFTLIEMLMVISLVSLLASIVVVAVGNATDKAKIASTQQFAASISGQLRDNIVAIWNFNDTTDPGKDSWEGKNNGTLNCNGGTCITDGVSGKALNFDGNDYVDVASSNLRPPVFTLSAWVYYLGGGWKMIIGNEQFIAVGTYRGFWLDIAGVEGGAPEIYDKAYLMVGAEEAESYGRLFSTNTIPINKWTYLAAVYDGYNMYLYINGIKDVNTDQAIISYTGQTNNLHIGMGGDVGVHYFNGTIDEVYIYNAALTAQEIQKLYAESAPRHGMAIK